MYINPMEICFFSSSQGLARNFLLAGERFKNYVLNAKRSAGYSQYYATCLSNLRRFRSRVALIFLI